ncbi:hypothetical protein [Alishewanella phage vB_AspM_Slicko01]|nr:hypothetical protein [Alishewanella phage vB_AspM_Slicko01]
MAEFYKVTLRNKSGGADVSTVIGSSEQTLRFAIAEAHSYGATYVTEFLGQQLPDDFKGTVLNLTNT